jgi:hypothetical protein
MKIAGCRVRRSRQGASPRTLIGGGPQAGLFGICSNIKDKSAKCAGAVSGVAIAANEPISPRSLWIGKIPSWLHGQSWLDDWVESILELGNC